MPRTSRQVAATAAGVTDITTVRIPATASPAGLQRVERNVVNNAELRANAQHIVSIIHTARPENTSSSYDPKQREFQEFCRSKQYHNGDTVTEDKLLLFLVEEVANRPLRAKSRKVASETPREETRLSWRSVRSYVTAITDLYRTQKALGMNSHPSPRVDNVREYLKSLQRRDAQRDKDNYADSVSGVSLCMSGSGSGRNPEFEVSANFGQRLVCREDTVMLCPSPTYRRQLAIQIFG